MAARRLPTSGLEYLDGGGGDDETRARAQPARALEILLLPRTLVDVSQRELAVPLFGTDIALPAVIAPTVSTACSPIAGDRVQRPGGARGGHPVLPGMVATVALEDIAATGVRHWMQIYPSGPRQPRRGGEAGRARRLRGDRAHHRRLGVPATADGTAATTARR